MFAAWNGILPPKRPSAPSDPVSPPLPTGCEACPEIAGLGGGGQRGPQETRPRGSSEDRRMFHRPAGSVAASPAAGWRPLLPPAAAQPPGRALSRVCRRGPATPAQRLLLWVAREGRGQPAGNRGTVAAPRVPWRRNRDRGLSQRLSALLAAPPTHVRLPLGGAAASAVEGSRDPRSPSRAPRPLCPRQVPLTVQPEPVLTLAPRTPLHGCSSDAGTSPLGRGR